MLNRRLRHIKSVRTDLATETTLQVGANNSGKSSATLALGEVGLQISQTVSSALFELPSTYQGRSSMPATLIPSENAQWFAMLGLGDMPDYSAISITLSNEPIEHWFYKRNKLRPESLKLRLLVPSLGGWRVELERHDELFLAQWRPKDDLRIESQQLRYRKLVAWPRLSSIIDFPQLIGSLERSLEVSFLPHADIGARLIDPETLAANLQLRQWLAPCASSLGWSLKVQPM